jgi:hypothetical protein
VAEPASGWDVPGGSGTGGGAERRAKFTASLVPLVEPLSKENMVGKELPRNSRRPTAVP